VNEKPILFNTEMVTAVIAGRKTTTRRVIKPQPNGRHRHIQMEYGYLVESLYERGLHRTVQKTTCPYGKVGDQLWVRERFCVGAIACGDHIAPDREPIYVGQCDGDNDYIFYEQALSAGWGMDDVKWKPSIHMPRKASRVQLEVTRVTVEPLKSISSGEIVEEGAGFTQAEEDALYVDWEKSEHVGKLESLDGWMDFKLHEKWRNLWNSINKARGFGMHVNPWVWVVSFKVLEIKCAD